MENDVLEQLYAFVGHIFNDVGEAKYDGVGPYKTNDIAYHVLGFLIDYSGFNEFPQVLPDDEFDAFKTKSYYHGFGTRENGKNFLDSFNYHYGYGRIIKGFYLTDIRTEAYKYVQDRLMESNEQLSYADISLATQQQLTAEFKLADMKSVGQHQLEVWSRKFGNMEEDSIEEPEVRAKLHQLRKFMLSHQGERLSYVFGNALLSLNLSALAVYLGFECIVDDVGYMVVLNRGKMAVKQSDFAKFQSDGGQEKYALVQRDLQ